MCVCVCVRMCVSDPIIENDALKFHIEKVCPTPLRSEIAPFLRECDPKSLKEMPTYYVPLFCRIPCEVFYGSMF